MDFFDNDNVSDDNKSDASFNILTGVRDALTIALGQQPPTYEKSLRHLKDIDESIYSAIVKHLPGKNQSDTVRRFIDLGKALQQNPVDLLDEEINKYKSALELADGSPSTLNLHIAQLYNAKEYFKERSLTEQKLLEHDFYISTRTKLKEIYTSAGRKDYKLPNGNHLRIYLAHPDKIEHVLGADLVYEQYDFSRNLVRFAHLQYKTWDDKSIRLSERDIQQLKRLENNNCSSNTCKKPSSYASSHEYRFPYCSAFLRPTSKLLKSSTKMKSTGLHIPLCKFINLCSPQGGTIKKNAFIESAISHTIFDESFNNYHIGSGWMPIGDLDIYYSRRNLNDLASNVRIHAQEVLHIEDELEDIF